MLPKAHVTLKPEADAGHSGLGLADTMPEPGGRSTLIDGCVAVADPLFTNFTTMRPCPVVLVNCAGKTPTVKQFGVALGGVPTSAQVFVLAALPIPAIPSTRAPAIVPTRAKRPQTTKNFFHMTPSPPKSRRTSIVNTFRPGSQCGPSTLTQEGLTVDLDGG